MRGSEDGLDKKNPGAAAPHEEQAIAQMKGSLDEMGRQFAQRLKQMQSMSFGGSGRLDPLGRPMSQDSMGSGRDSNVKIPDQSERRRVQEILKTLRDRSGEVGRPDYELDYFRRLMKQF
jgi:hypothetical protein